LLVVYFEFTIGTQGVKVDQEIFTRAGRSDVRVLAFTNSENWEQAIMELKVLGVHSQDAEEWALEGIEQLIGYRSVEEKQTVDCYLCCYDARKTDADIPTVLQAATEANVHHRRYFLKTPGMGV
jgi:hypothetical protein